MRSETIILLIFIAVPLIIGIYFIKEIRIPYKILVSLIFCTLITEFLAEYSAHKFKSNLVIYHFFCPVEYMFLALFYTFFLKNQLTNILIKVSIFLFFPFSIINSFFIQKFYSGKINSHAILAESVLIVCIALLYLYQLLKSNDNYNIYKLGVFWVSIGCLLFFATNVFFWGYYNYLTQLKPLRMTLFFKILFWENILLYSIFGIALIAASKEIKYE
jgi:hypothetical protein